MNGYIFDIKEMAVHDGPGIRTTVFFKGCPLRCAWCHNPEGLTTKPQLMYKRTMCTGCNNCLHSCEHDECKQFKRCIYRCPNNCLEIVGRTVTAKDLSSELIKNAEVLGNTFGGFTFSGGEPFAQIDFLNELIGYLNGYNLCIETSGYVDSDIFRSVINRLDYIIMDIKLADSELHKKYTGVDNKVIIENFKILKASGKPYIIRTPLIPNVTDTDENLLAIKQLIGNSEWEQLPFNAAAGAKYDMLGLKWTF